MSLPPDNPQEILRRARQVIALESTAVLSASESLDQKFLAVAEVLLACTGKVLITGSGTSGTIAMRAAHLFSAGGTPAFYLLPNDGLHGGAALLALAVDQRPKGMSTSLREVRDQYVDLDCGKSARPTPPASSIYRELYEEFCEMLKVEFFNDE